jgi:hypothetical protein
MNRKESKEIVVSEAKERICHRSNRVHVGWPAVNPALPFVHETKETGSDTNAM